MHSAQTQCLVKRNAQVVFEKLDTNKDLVIDRDELSIAYDTFLDPMKSLQAHFTWRLMYFFRTFKDRSGVHIDLDKLRFPASDKSEEVRNHNTNRNIYNHMLKSPAMDFAIKQLLDKYDTIMTDNFLKVVEEAVEKDKEEERVKELEEKKRLLREAEYDDEDDEDDAATKDEM